MSAHGSWLTGASFVGALAAAIVGVRVLSAEIGEIGADARHACGAPPVAAPPFRVVASDAPLEQPGYLGSLARSNAHELLTNVALGVAEPHRVVVGALFATSAVLLASDTGTGTGTAQPTPTPVPVTKSGGATCNGAVSCKAQVFPPCVPTFVGGTCVGTPTCDGPTCTLVTCLGLTCSTTATCAFSTCIGGATCAGATCTGGATCTAVGTCAPAGTCSGGVTCQGVATCNGTATCNYTATCNASPTCTQAFTCNGALTCGQPTCVNSATCGGPTCVGPTCFDLTCVGKTCSADQAICPIEEGPVDGEAGGSGHD